MINSAKFKSTAVSDNTISADIPLKIVYLRNMEQPDQTKVIECIHNLECEYVILHGTILISDKDFSRLMDSIKSENNE